MRHWTLEERQRQAELIRQWKPWNHSTGAKTIEGKAKSSRNAFTGGLMKNIRSLGKQMNKLIREQKQFIKI